MGTKEKIRQVNERMDKMALALKQVINVVQGLDKRIRKINKDLKQMEEKK